MRSLSLKQILILLWVLALGALVGLGYFLLWSPRGAALAGDPGRGDYSLVTHDGGSFTEASLQGAPSLVFFGFTHCPDVCPTTLADIATWQDMLGARAESLRIFVISVDPARDTPEILADYVGWLPGARGVTGTTEQTIAALQSFRVFARTVPGENGDYTVDHSSSVMMFDRNGRFAGTISYQTPPEVAVTSLDAIL